MSQHIIWDGALHVERLSVLAEPPPLWERGEPHFWNDPHIAQQMLAAHLDPDNWAASRPPHIIDASVAWISERLGLQAGDALLDIGCGPGLYTRRFAARGLRVTGVDFSENSLNHARAHDPATTYRHLNYLELDDEAAYDAVTFIYGDYCPLDDDERARLLANVRRALKPGGWFVLDVSTPLHHERHNCGNGWAVYPAGGFWKPGPYLELTRNFAYPEQDMALHQYAIIEADGALSVYRNWFRDFTPETITAELAAGGFVARGLYADLWGTPLDPEGEWIGVVAQA